MIKLTIADKSYNLKSESKDFTLKEYIDFNKVVSTIPETLKEYYASLLSNEDFDKKYSYIEWVNFYDRVFKFFSNYKEKNTKLDPEELSKIYNDYLIWMVIKTLHPYYDAESHKHKPIYNFTLNKVEYKLLDKFMRNGTIEQYGEVQDSFNNPEGLQDYYIKHGLDIQLDKIINGNLKAYPYMLAILYKPQDEAYDENKLGERAKEFLSLNMEIVWGIEVFFWKQTTSSMKSMASYFKSQKRKGSRKAKATRSSLDGITVTR